MSVSVARDVPHQKWRHHIVGRPWFTIRDQYNILYFGHLWIISMFPMVRNGGISIRPLGGVWDKQWRRHLVGGPWFFLFVLNRHRAISILNRLWMINVFSMGRNGRLMLISAARCVPDRKCKRNSISLPRVSVCAPLEFFVDLLRFKSYFSFFFHSTRNSYWALGDFGPLP